MVKISLALDKAGYSEGLEKKWDSRGTLLTTEDMHQHPRATFDWPLTIDRDGEAISGRIVKIICGGALICIPVELHPKEQLRMAIEIPEHDDVISVKGVVTRTSTNLTENGQPSFASGIMFTEITKEDLRYFTGNLVPEWSKDYREQAAPSSRPDKSAVTASQRQNSPWKPIAKGLGALSVVALFFALQKTPSNEYDTERIAALEERLHFLELKKSPDDRANTLVGELNEQIAALHSQLTESRENSRQMAMQPGSTVIHSQPPAESLNTSSPTASTAPPTQLPTSAATPESDITQALPSETKVHIQPQVTLEAPPAANRYHVVQSGQNLYRIGLKNQLSVEELRTLNSLKPDDAIYPGQRLLISKADAQPLGKGRR